MTLAAATGSAPALDRRVPEPVEATRDEDRRAVEVERRLDAPDARGGRLGELGTQPLDELGRRLDRHEVGLGEVAVVVRLLLRPPGGERARRRVEVVRVLLDRAAGLPDVDLALDLGLDPARDEVEGVHVLDLGSRAELVRPGRTHGDVGVDAQRPLLHLGVRDPELDDGLPEELEEAFRLVGRADVRRGHDLDERRAAAVEVDERRVRAADPAGPPSDVDGLGRVLLEMRSHDPDHTIAVCSW